jgi:hypothetical protein
MLIMGMLSSEKRVRNEVFKEKKDTRYISDKI